MSAVLNLVLPGFPEPKTLLLVAGWGQLALATASFAVPTALGWRTETARLSPLTRQTFWAYAGYVLGAHVAFGLASLLLADDLVSGSRLARAVCGFIAIWWGVRLGIALLGCERREIAKRPAWVRWADRVLLLAFAGLALGYGALAAGGWTTGP